MAVRPSHILFAVLGLALASRPTSILYVLFFIFAVLTTSLALGLFIAWRNALIPPSNRMLPRLAFASQANLSLLSTRYTWSLQNAASRTPLHPTSSKVSEALDDLIAVILKNHLLNWFTEISPSDPAFPNAVEATIRHALANVRDRVIHVDWATLAVSKIIPRLTTHLEMFEKAERALLRPVVPTAAGNSRKKRKSNAPASSSGDELDLLLANKYAEFSGGLHPAIQSAGMNSKPGEEAHLRKLIGEVLSMVLPTKDGESPAVLVMAREIVACAILRPVFEAVSEPDTWNKVIDENAGNAIREQKMVRQLRQALDANSAAIASATSSRRRRISLASDIISIKSDSKQFERFVRSISKCKSLVEARRLKSDIILEINRAALAAAHEEDKADLNFQEAYKLYLNRLNTAKQTIEHRIARLSGPNAQLEINTINEKAMDTLSAPAATVRQILSQPSALPFFMEFMDRRHRSLLVQFYLIVDGLKNPLDESLDNPQDRKRTDAAVETFADDLAMIDSLYFASGSVSVDSQLVEIIRLFVDGTEGCPSLIQARKAIFSAQKSVEQQMAELDWEEFIHSDLYIKALSALSNSDSYGSSKLVSTKVAPPLATTNMASKHSLAAPPFLRSLSLPEVPVLPMPSFSNLIPFPSSKAAPLVRMDTAPVTSYRPSSALSSSFDSSQLQVPSTPSHPSRRAPLNLLMQSPRSVSIAAGTRKPLFNDEDDGNISPVEDDEQKQTIEAIQDALTSILSSDNHSPSATEHSSPRPESVRSLGSIDHGRSFAVSSISSLSPKQTESPPSTRKARKALFADDHGNSSSDTEGEESSPAFSADNLQTLAIPAKSEAGSDTLAKISDRIAKLHDQEEVLDTLQQKAELSGNYDELKILRKSLNAVKREIRELSFQQSQLESQGSPTMLSPEKSRVSITGTTLARPESGGTFVLYLVEVHQLSNEGTLIAGWFCTRRFSEFVALHGKLKDQFAEVRALDLPHRRLVGTSTSNTVTQARRAALEKYLQALMQIPSVCDSTEFRDFLSQQNITLPPFTSVSMPKSPNTLASQSLVRSLYRSVTSGVDDILGGPVSMLDAIIQGLQQQASDFAHMVSSTAEDDGRAPSLSASVSSLETPGMEAEQPEELNYFTAPIANLIVEIFDLKDKSSWLRRQAIVIVLQQILGGTIERKVREAISTSLGGDNLLPYIQLFSNMIWPNGELKPPTPPRTAEQKLATRESASRKLTAIMPDLGASLLGRSNSRRGARRIFAILQNRRLLQHLAYTLLDDILFAIFPELARLPEGGKVKSVKEGSVHARSGHSV